jgi:hypothetical protein
MKELSIIVVRTLTERVIVINDGKAYPYKFSVFDGMKESIWKALNDYEERKRDK